MRIRGRRSGGREGFDRSHRGQSLVEFALLLPLLLILLLGAIDFGRVFFGWVALNNAARIGANYAATHPNAWLLNNSDQIQAYTDLIEESGATNCDTALSDPSFPDGRELGDRARVRLTCDFELITGWMAQVFGGDGSLTVTANATFPIRQGCVNCAGAPAAPPPPPPPNCRTVPEMAGLSVSGARLLWGAAGFTGAFSPATGPDDTRTVATWTISQPEPGCDSDAVDNAFFSSSIVVSLAPTAPVEDGCITVPNLLGMLVADARVAWVDAGFVAANFDPPAGDDDQVVEEATFSPDSLAGECKSPDLLVSVTTSPPPPPPPAPPCRVPSFVNTDRAAAQVTWTAAGFTTFVQFHPPAQNWSVITQQSLVAGTWAGCGSDITLSR